ncbi:MAG: site-specific DNA-methyltransferase, partial [Methylococcaceae bacterium]
MDKLDKDTDGSSLNIVQNNIDTLKTLFPDIVSEGKIDLDALRAILGESLETAEERYNFTWHGKSAARRIAQTPSTGTLRPCKEESKQWDTTQNLFIEGDNLEVLKLLQKSYHKQVKMIYIDPPYNTGKEFIYPDNYKDNLDTYLEYTGQKDSEGRKFGTNAETSGRYHTNWLNMMYPRLKLARNLLRDDGVIFISIDDNEVANLRKLCDEIFGEENFVGNIIWRNVTDNNPTNIATEHE